MLKSIFLDFIRFLKKPNDFQYGYGLKEKVILIFLFIAIEVVIVYSIVYPIDILFPIDLPHFDYSETIPNMIMLNVILIPLAEELMFRYILRYKGFLRKIIKRKLWDKTFPFLVYLSSFLFGYIHMGNFENLNVWHWIFLPFIVLSQLLGGFVISFVRVRLNFWWGFLYHSLWNLIFCLLVFANATHFEEKAEKYTINIQEKAYFNKEISQCLKVDSLNKKINTLKVEQYSLRHILDTLYGKNKYYLNDVLINLEFYSKEGTAEEDFIKILSKEYDIRKNK